VTVWSIFGLELASFPFSRRRYLTHELSKLAYWRASVARLFFFGLTIYYTVLERSPW